MEQYVSKAALVAEIERLIDSHKPLKTLDPTYCEGLDDSLDDVLSFLDTLEIKDEVVLTDPIKAMTEALRIEYEKGRADAIAQMQKEWSEEDKDFMYDTLSNLTELKDRYGEGYGNVGKCIDWLKILKQRIGGEV